MRKREKESKTVWREDMKTTKHLKENRKRRLSDQRKWKQLNNKIKKKQNKINYFKHKIFVCPDNIARILHSDLELGLADWSWLCEMWYFTATDGNFSIVAVIITFYHHYHHCCRYSLCSPLLRMLLMFILYCWHCDHCSYHYLSPLLLLFTLFTYYKCYWCSFHIVGIVITVLIILIIIYHHCCCHCALFTITTNVTFGTIFLCFDTQNTRRHEQIHINLSSLWG